MGPFDVLEKLINEHGSAAILKERIDLAREQYSALEKKLADSEAKCGELSSMTQGLELENYKLKDKIRNLESQLDAKKGDRLEKAKEDLLEFLAANDRTREDILLHRIGATAQVTLFHLHELSKSKLLQVAHLINSPPEWSLTQDGRRYLINHELLK